MRGDRIDGDVRPRRDGHIVEIEARRACGRDGGAVHENAGIDRHTARRQRIERYRSRRIDGERVRAQEGTDRNVTPRIEVGRPPDCDGAAPFGDRKVAPRRFGQQVSSHGGAAQQNGVAGNIDVAPRLDRAYGNGTGPYRDQVETDRRAERDIRSIQQHVVMGGDGIHCDGAAGRQRNVVEPETGGARGIDGLPLDVGAGNNIESARSQRVERHAKPGIDRHGVRAEYGTQSHGPCGPQVRIAADRHDPVGRSDRQVACRRGGIQVGAGAAVVQRNGRSRQGDRPARQSFADTHRAGADHADIQTDEAVDIDPGGIDDDVVVRLDLGDGYVAPRAQRHIVEPEGVGAAGGYGSAADPGAGDDRDIPARNGGEVRRATGVDQHSVLRFQNVDRDIVRRVEVGDPPDFQNAAGAIADTQAARQRGGGNVASNRAAIHCDGGTGEVRVTA